MEDNSVRRETVMRCDGVYWNATVSTLKAFFVRAYFENRDIPHLGISCINIYISNKMLYQQRYTNHIPWIFVARVENDCPSWFAGCLICVFHSEADLTDGKSCRLWTNKLHFFSHSFYSIQKCSSAACVAGFHQQKRSVPNCIEQRRCYLVHCAWQGINYVYIYIDRREWFNNIRR